MAIGLYRNVEMKSLKSTALVVTMLLLQPLLLSVYGQEENDDVRQENLDIQLRDGTEVTRQKDQSTMFALGYANILDTYLSQEKYSGSELRVISQMRKQYGHLVHTFVSQGGLSMVSNRADNRDEVGGRYEFLYHFRYQWIPFAGGSSEWQIEVGGGVESGLGFLYNLSNTNNPVQLQAALNMAPSVATNYKMRFLRRTPVLHYEVSIPAVGVMFSPNYGQSYYEIFSRGNYDNNIVQTTTLDTPSLRHALIFDLPLSIHRQSPILRLGYLGDYRQSEVNHLKYHHYSHLFVIGWTKTL